MRAYETRCEACHVPFTPINRSGWTKPFEGWTRSVAADTKVSEQKCQDCHKTFPHYKLEASADSCASCHKDHQGRDIPLIAMGNGQCVDCHGKLAESHLTRSDGKPVQPLVDVNEFGADESEHPEFALFRKGPPVDPGKIKFNHALHMTPGLPSKPGEKPLITQGNLPEDWQAFYKSDSRSANPSEPVSLRCDSCHELGSRSTGLVSPEDSARRGDVMLPIRFDKHCVACHSSRVAEGQAPVRHGLQPSDLFDELWRLYSSEFIKEHPEVKLTRVSRIPLPGRDGLAEASEATVAARTEVAGQVRRAERALYAEKRCLECHSLETSAGASYVLDDGEIRRYQFQIASAAIPKQWFEHASFDHAAHQSSTCLDCHAGASPAASRPSSVSADVLIPDSKNCRKCHSATASLASSPRGSAGTACTECHSYHGQDRLSLEATGPSTTRLRQPEANLIELIQEMARPSVARHP